MSSDKMSSDKILSDKKLTKCKCPRCEKIHTLLIYWTGKFMPRKFCKNCKEQINGGGTYSQTDHRRKYGPKRPCE